MQGRVVKAPQYSRPPLADANPEGKAARRRRKQMERQLQKQVGPIELLACDACGLEATGRCPHCQALTCGFCDSCEHSQQNRAHVWERIADSSGSHRPDRQDLARLPIVDAPYIPADQVEAAKLTGMVLADKVMEDMMRANGVDGGATLTWTDENGIQQRHVPRSELYLSDINEPAGFYYNTPADAEPGKRLTLDGTITVGVDPGHPDGDVTTVAIRKGGTVIILDEASQVPQHVWDEFSVDVSRRINERIATELGGGQLPLMNRTRALAKSGARHSLVLGALLAATMPAKPKE